MENKNIAKGLLIGGVLLWCVPIFLEGIIGTIIRFVGFVLMPLGVIVLIAGDKLTTNFSFKLGGNNISKEMQKKYKNGEITYEEFMAFQKQQIKFEAEKIALEVAKLRNQQAIETEKATLRKLKQLHKPKPQGSALGGGGKLPDVLGNMGDLMGSSKPQSGDGLASIMGTNTPNDKGLREVIGTKTKTKKNSLDDLSDLF